MTRDYDVLVLGGGTAGVVAAIAAARSGAATLVIEKNSYLGGVAATSIPFLGMYDGRDRRVNAGIPQELVERMKAEGGSLDGVFGATWMDKDYRFSITPFEEETYKFIAQEMLVEAGAEVLFHTFISRVFMDGDHIQGVEVVNKSGTSLYTAKTYVDCTGDADVAYRCQVPMVEKQHVQNASMLFKIGGVDTKRVYEALQNGDGITGWDEWHNRILVGPRLDDPQEGVIHMAGHFVGPGGRETTFTAISTISDQFSINATRTVGIDGTSAEDLSRAEISERRNVHDLVVALRQKVPGMEKCHLLYTAPIGIRESRNIIGDYVLQKEDVLSARQFDDAVVRGAYPIDIHDPKGGRTQFHFIKDGGSYSIPYRCFVPKGVDNLLVAGRSLSASHEAMGTARIMGAVMSQGQAMGTAAAQLAAANKLTREIDIAALQQALTAAGALI
jgi:hypothetical protein